MIQTKSKKERNMDINVRLLQVFPVQTITSKDGTKTWQKQEFLTETIDNSQYSRKICFTLFGDSRVGIVDQFKINDIINVSFDLQSREANGRWFSSIDAWRVTSSTMGSPISAPNSQPGQYMAQQPIQANETSSVNTSNSEADGGEDDLPF